MRVESVEGGGGRARSGPRCWGPPRAAACAPTSAASSSAEGERFGWEQLIAGHALRAPPAPLRGRDRACATTGDGTEVTLAAAQTLRGLSRLGSPMMRRGQGALLDEALDGLERALDERASFERMTEVASPRRDSKWWGWGDPSIAPELDGPALETLRERIGELRAASPPPELDDFELPPAQALPPALIEAVGEENVFTAAEDRLRHATGCGYVDLARLRSGRLDAAPDAVAAAGRRRRGETRSGALRDGGRCGRPLRRWHQRGRRGRAAARRPRAPDQPRPGAPARRRGRPPLAHRPPRRRPARARGRSRAGQARARPRPLPAVLRVRHDRRLRRHPLGRAGLERLRPLRLAGQLGAPDRARPATWRRWRRRTPPPARRCASSWSAPRASSA